MEMGEILRTIPLGEYIEQGGVMMYPLLLCSLIAVAVIIERALRLRRSKLIDPAIVDDIQKQIELGTVERALDRYQRGSALVGRILTRGIEEYRNTSADIETALVEAGERGLHILHNNMAILNLIARIAPLLGLLGTVLGMINGFKALSQAGVGKEQLAVAISVALITTATGLIIAIPTLIAATYFRTRIQRIQAEFEEIFIDVIKSVKASENRTSVETTAAGSPASTEGPA